MLVRELLRRLKGSARGDAFEREMAAELELHIELEAEALAARGMDRAEALREARRRFGSVAQVRDACRDSWGLRAIDELRQDARYAVRVLARAPGYTAVVLLTLALGIGANTAIFSVVHAVLLRSLPYANGDALVELKQLAPTLGADTVPFSAVEIADYRRLSTTLDAVVEYHQMGFNLLDPRGVSRVTTGVVSADFFDVIGVTPMLGRSFRASDDVSDAPAVLILSYAYWQTALGGDPQVIGRTFEMNDRVHTVVGVLPPVPAYPEANDVYMPVSSCPFRSAPHMQHERSMRMVQAIGRLKRGVTLEQAQRDLAAVASRLATEHPDAYGRDTAYTATVAAVREQLTSRARPTLLLLAATTVFVLLLVCANVANLTLARLAGRERELSLRTAIGAGRGRIARQLVTENLLLALGGGALGLAIAVLARGLLVAFTSRFTPRAAEIGIDRTVLLFALAVSIVTGLLCALIPATRTRVRPARAGVRGALITAQVAISFVLLIAAGLTVRSFVKLQAVDAGFGFAADHVLTAQVDLDWVKYPSSETRRAFFRSLLATVEQQPGVKRVAWGIKYPLDRSAPFRTDFLVEAEGGQGQIRKLADYRLVSPDYFQTIGMTLVGGRAFTARDAVGAPAVAIVNVSMARRQLGSADPSAVVGRRISLDNGRSWTTVVGLVNDVKQYGLDTDASDELYVPFEQRGPLSATLLVRTTADPDDMLRTVQRVAREIDPEQPVSHPQTLAQARRGSLDSPRVTMVLVSLFAIIALVITAAGIAGVVSFAVNERTVEIGVRMALGATCASVVGLMVRRGMRPVALGLACGVAGAAVMAPPVSRLLYAVGPTDPATYGAVVSTLAVVAALACFAPARRAAAVDPMQALKSE